MASHQNLVLPQFGFGAIVDDNIDKPWVKSHDYTQLLGECMNLGIRYLDSAQLYGKNEELLGQWLSTQPDHVLDELLVGSKVSGSSSFEEPMQPLTRSYVIDIANQSFKKLHGKLDIFWLHQPEAEPN